jgi:hypothetical protein
MADNKSDSSRIFEQIKTIVSFVSTVVGLTVSLMEKGPVLVDAFNAFLKYMGFIAGTFLLLPALMVAMLLRHVSEGEISEDSNAFFVIVLIPAIPLGILWGHYVTEDMWVMKALGALYVIIFLTEAVSHFKNREESLDH